MDLDDLIEIAAHVESLRMLVLPMVAREEQREIARIKKARQRAQKPTTHTKTDGPLSRTA